MSRSKGRSHSSGGRDRRTKSAPERIAPGADLGLRVGSWTLLFHPLLLDQIERVVSAAEREKSKLSSGEPDGPNMKLAAAMRRIILAEVPEDPSRPTYRHGGGTLGEQLKHWLRAKFGNGRFRLFFRYRRDAALIVFAWVNDTETLRTYGSSTDAYAVFRQMLGGGNPPDDWDELVGAALTPETLRRAQALFGEDRTS
jgi:toxin YhaV